MRNILEGGISAMLENVSVTGTKFLFGTTVVGFVCFASMRFPPNGFDGFKIQERKNPGPRAGAKLATYPVSTRLNLARGPV
jgi:hypothetical protein